MPNFRHIFVDFEETAKLIKTHDIVKASETIKGGLFLAKKQVWYEVEENETIEQCLERMKKDGYMPFGRMEEPIFHMVDGEPVVLRQKIKFKGVLVEE